MTDTPEPRSEPIAVGDPAPKFSLPAIRTDGAQFDAVLDDILKDGELLLVFYQDDGMPICTSQLKVFSQEFETLDSAGVQVYAINANGIGSHQKFQERDAFPFPLISDFYGDTIRAYGLWDDDERKSRRALVVIDQQGIVSYVQPHYNPGNVNALVEVMQALGLV